MMIYPSAHGFCPGAARRGDTLKRINAAGAIIMPGLYFTITILIGIALYILLSIIQKQNDEEQENEQIFDNSIDFYSMRPKRFNGINHNHSRLRVPRDNKVL